jgi:hypothetical protein
VKEKISDQQLIQAADRAIKKSSFYKSNPPETVYAALLMDSHWDREAKRTKIHTALGGPGDPSLGIFGSHLTHAWPENEDQLIDRFLDSRPIDFSQLANDDSPTKSRSLNVGIGALLHELGHSLTLGNLLFIYFYNFHFYHV